MRLLFFMLFLSSCVSLNTRMNRWLDQPADDLVASWGMPDRTTTYNGKKVMVYSQPRYATQYGVIYRYTTFIVDRHGLIESWSYRELAEPVETVNVNVLIR